MEANKRIERKWLASLHTVPETVLDIATFPAEVPTVFSIIWLKSVIGGIKATAFYFIYCQES